MPFFSYLIPFPWSDMTNAILANLADMPMAARISQRQEPSPVSLGGLALGW